MDRKVNYLNASIFQKLSQYSNKYSKQVYPTENIIVDLKFTNTLQQQLY